MPNNKSPERRLISFLYQQDDVDKIQQDIDSGWSVTSMFFNGRSYIGILEKKLADFVENAIYIPPRRKIKITSK